MEELIERARKSGQSEARLLADLVDDILKDGGDMNLVCASLYNLSGWSSQFVKEALKSAT